MARTSSLRQEPSFQAPMPTNPSHERPVDLVHLSHQTMGDTALEREVLGLLARQIASISGRLERAAHPERLRVAHTLKGAALNIGAFRLARAAEALEHFPSSDEALARFEAEMVVTSDFLAALLQAPSEAR